CAKRTQRDQPIAGSRLRASSFPGTPLPCRRLLGAIGYWGGAQGNRGRSTETIRMNRAATPENRQVFCTAGNLTVLSADGPVGSQLGNLWRRNYMKKRPIADGGIAAGLILMLASCTNPYDPAQRTVGGGLLGAGAGAAIGGAVGGGHGAALGAAIGGATGAVTGAATTPPPPPPNAYYGPPGAYGQPAPGYGYPPSGYSQPAPGYGYSPPPNYPSY